jgi:hypothetical protein
VNCKENTKNRSNDEGYTRNSYPRRPHESQNRSYNIFGSLSNEVECSKCNNFGHIAKDCRTYIPLREPKKIHNSYKKEPQRIWIRKQDQFNTEECNLSLQAQHKKRGWYVDSGCSKHMTGDKDKVFDIEEGKRWISVIWK